MSNPYYLDLSNLNWIPEYSFVTGATAAAPQLNANGLAVGGDGIHIAGQGAPYGAFSLQYDSTTPIGGQGGYPHSGTLTVEMVWPELAGSYQPVPFTIGGYVNPDKAPILSYGGGAYGAAQSGQVLNLTWPTVNFGTSLFLPISHGGSGFSTIRIFAPGWIPCDMPFFG